VVERSKPRASHTGDSQHPGPRTSGGATGCRCYGYKWTLTRSEKAAAAATIRYSRCFMRVVLLTDENEVVAQFSHVQRLDDSSWVAMDDDGRIDTLDRLIHRANYLHHRDRALDPDG